MMTKDQDEIMNIGFTGTREGMTTQQRSKLCEVLSQYPSSTFIHGDCTGADEQAFIIARSLGFTTVTRPCTIEKMRAHTKSDKVHLPTSSLLRNRKIVKQSDIVIACPKNDKEVLRSGTWATIRYFKTCGKQLIIIYPSGLYETHCFHNSIGRVIGF